MQRPALLRFTSDDFMDELVALLAEDPEQLAALEAIPVSYRLRPPAAARRTQPPVDHLKLFQPVHGHFNLVAATLVCRVVGLPDKGVDPGAEEAVTFVLRRLEAGAELAWTGAGWSAVEDAAALVEGRGDAPDVRDDQQRSAIGRGGSSWGWSRPPARQLQEQVRRAADPEPGEPARSSPTRGRSSSRSRSSTR